MSDDPIPEIIDHSRVDAYAAARRRAMVLHSMWRPMLAGAAGASLIIAAVYVTLPKLSVREVEIPRITYRDVPVDHVVPHDVQVDRIVPHDVPGPVAANPPSPPSDAPRTPSEKKFTESPAYKSATIYRGRIVASTDGKALSVADGTSLWPAHWDAETSQTVYDSDDMTALKAALAFAVGFGLTWLWLANHNTAFCNTSKTNIDFLLCHIEHGAHGL
jgi:hypothetical protein